MQNQTLVWRSGNSAGHMNKVKLRRATRLVLGLLTTFGGSNLPSILHATQAHSARPPIRGSVQRVLALVSATTGEETASSAYQWALLSGLLAYSPAHISKG